MKKLIFIAVATIFLAGCENKQYFNQTNSGSLYHITFPDFKQYPDSLKMFVKGNYFVPLETSIKSLLGEVQIIKVNGENIIMSDFKKMVAFKMDEEMTAGKITSCINRIGKGPGEYPNIVDFTFNSKYYFVYSGMKIHQYDINTLEFVKSIKLDFCATEVTAYGDYLIFFTLSVQNAPVNRFELIVLDTKNNKRYKYFKQTEKCFDSKSQSSRQINKYGNDVYYCAPFRNIVYKFTDEAKPIAFVNLDYNNNEIIDLYKVPELKNTADIVRSNYYYLFSDLKVLKDRLGIDFMYKGMPGVIWFNTKNKSAFIMGQSSSELVYKDILISPVDSWAIASFEPLKFKNDTIALKAYSKVLNTTKDDNPCLSLTTISHE